MKREELLYRTHQVVGDLNVNLLKKDEDAKVHGTGTIRIIKIMAGIGSQEAQLKDRVH